MGFGDRLIKGMILVCSRLAYKGKKRGRMAD